MTTGERMLHYAKMIEWYQDDNYPHRKEVGLCWNTDELGVSVYEAFNGHGVFRERLPELYKQKPRKMYNRNFWWKNDNYKRRIKALNDAIELCKKEMWGN